MPGPTHIVQREGQRGGGGGDGLGTVGAGELEEAEEAREEEELVEKEAFGEEEVVGVEEAFEEETLARYGAACTHVHGWEGTSEGASPRHRGADLESRPPSLSPFLAPPITLGISPIAPSIQPLSCLPTAHPAPCPLLDCSHVLQSTKSLSSRSSLYGHRLMGLAPDTHTKLWVSRPLLTASSATHTSCNLQSP